METLAQSKEIVSGGDGEIPVGFQIESGARTLGRRNVAARDRGGGHERALRFYGTNRRRAKLSRSGREVAGRTFHHRGRESAGLGFFARAGIGGAGQARGIAFAHATKLKATIKSLAEKDYPGQFPNALDYVVLFLPAESLFSAALEGDRDLIIWAAEKRILLATPASLIALLRSVSVSWQQHSQTENAQKIAEAAQEIFRAW